MVDAIDLRTDTSYWWYDRRTCIGGMTDEGVVRMFQLNHACDPTNPQGTQMEVLV